MYWFITYETLDSLRLTSKSKWATRKTASNFLSVRFRLGGPQTPMKNDFTNLRNADLAALFQRLLKGRKRPLKKEEEQIVKDMLLLLMFRNYTAHHSYRDHDFQHNDRMILKAWIDACVSVPIFLAQFVDQCILTIP